jgi:phage terminase Nu1 subunit (DNA packaging protein)
MALTGQELCERLQIDQVQLSAWLKLGLPANGRGKARRFEPSAVAAWLIENKLAEPAEIPTNQPIANTWAQVAEYFQVSERTVATWLNQGMPGKRGRPGTREGQFPLHDIESWREGRSGPRIVTDGESKSEAQARLARIKAAREEMAFRKELLQLVDATDLERRWLRLEHEIKAQLAQLPTLIVKALGESTSDDTRKKIRGRVKRTIDGVLATLALFMEQEADGVEAPPQQQDGSAAPEPPESV